MCVIKKTACAAAAALSFLAGAAQAAPSTAEAQKWEQELTRFADAATTMPPQDKSKRQALRFAFSDFDSGTKRLWGEEHLCSRAAIAARLVSNEVLSLTDVEASRRR